MGFGYYHTTTKTKWEQIKNGKVLKMNQSPTFSIGSLLYIRDIYNGNIPIFLSREPYKYNENRQGVTLQIKNIDKKEIYPDIPTILSSHNGYLGEEKIFFMEGEVPPEINFIDNPDDYRYTSGEISFKDLLNNNEIKSALIRLTKTAAIARNINFSDIEIFYEPLDNI